MTCALVNPTSGYSTFSRLVSFSVRPSIWTSTDVSLATFAHHLFGRLVEPEALERRRTELSPARPLDELELCHDLRLDEVCRPGRRARGVRALVGGQRLEHLVELFERGVGEAGAHLARVDELAAVVVADEKRSRVPAALALALEPAAHDQLLAVAVLDLHPHPGAATRLVLRRELLGH